MDSEPNIRNKISRGKFTAVFSTAMSGSDRNKGSTAVDLVLPLVGVLIACLISFGMGYWTSEDLNHAKQERYQSYRYAADKPQEVNPALAEESNPQTLEKREPCRNPRGKDESDLCAQWKAARAAEAGVLWTRRGLWVSVVGAALSFVSIVLVLRALGHARDANEIAREAAERQLRPYVFFINHPDNDYLKVAPEGWAKFMVKNFGQTPAEEATVRFGYALSPLPIGEPEIDFELFEELGRLPPQGDYPITIYFDQLSSQAWENINSGRFALLMRGRIEYSVGGERDHHEIITVSMPHEIPIGRSHSLSKDACQRTYK